MGSPVAVITARSDAAADLVVCELHRRNVPVFRFDLHEFPAQLTHTARITGHGGPQWSGRLRTTRRELDLTEVSAVWYRKPSEFGFRGMSATGRAWAAAEAKVGFGGQLMALRGVRWINPPHAAAAAEPRPHQLTAAAEFGLRIPDTLITNDPDEARTFCREHGDQVLYKPMTGTPPKENGTARSLYATSVTAETITDEVAHTAHLFQARVPCAFSARVVVVAGRIFAARIDAPPGTLDWRTTHDQLEYSAIEVPEVVAEQLRGLMEHFGLVYCSSDWIVTPGGDWVFIADLNTCGQWAWIRQLRDPVTEALADVLTGKDS